MKAMTKTEAIAHSDLEQLRARLTECAASQIDLESFGDWFADYAFGRRGPRGNPLADAIAKVEIAQMETCLGEFDGDSLRVKLGKIAAELLVSSLQSTT